MLAASRGRSFHPSPPLRSNENYAEAQGALAYFLLEQTEILCYTWTIFSHQPSYKAIISFFLTSVFSLSSPVTDNTGFWKVHNQHDWAKTN